MFITLSICRSFTVQKKTKPRGSEPQVFHPWIKNLHRDAPLLQQTGDAFRFGPKLGAGFVLSHALGSVSSSLSLLYPIPSGQKKHDRRSTRSFAVRRPNRPRPRVSWSSGIAPGPPMPTASWTCQAAPDTRTRRCVGVMMAKVD